MLENITTSQQIPGGKNKETSIPNAQRPFTFYLPQVGPGRCPTPELSLSVASSSFFGAWVRLARLPFSSALVFLLGCPRFGSQLFAESFRHWTEGWMPLLTNEAKSQGRGLLIPRPSFFKGSLVSFRGWLPIIFQLPISRVLLLALVREALWDNIKESPESCTGSIQVIFQAVADFTLTLRLKFQGLLHQLPVKTSHLIYHGWSHSTRRSLPDECMVSLMQVLHHIVRGQLQHSKASRPQLQDFTHWNQPGNLLTAFQLNFLFLNFEILAPHEEYRRATFHLFAWPRNSFFNFDWHIVFPFQVGMAATKGEIVCHPLESPGRGSVWVRNRLWHSCPCSLAFEFCRSCWRYLDLLSSPRSGGHVLDFWLAKCTSECPHFPKARSIVRGLPDVPVWTPFVIHSDRTG